MQTPPVPPNMVVPWFWDSQVLAFVQAATGVASVLLAAGAVYYAWRVATRQFEIIDEQATLVEKQLWLLEDQAATARRVELASLTYRQDGSALRVRDGGFCMVPTGAGASAGGYTKWAIGNVDQESVDFVDWTFVTKEVTQGGVQVRSFDGGRCEPAPEMGDCVRIAAIMHRIRKESTAVELTAEWQILWTVEGVRKTRSDVVIIKFKDTRSVPSIHYNYEVAALFLSWQQGRRGRVKS